MKTCNMVESLEAVLTDAKRLGSEYGYRNVSIGIEALVWDEGMDIPVDGYAYADLSSNEGNMGVYRSYNWLRGLVKDMRNINKYIS